MGQRMENFIYRVVTMTIAVLVCLVSSSCAKKVTIPDLSNVAIEDARNVLTNAGLIPSVEYEYSNDYAEGIVIKTDPTIGEQVELQTKVNLIVSKGPEYVDAKNSSVSWYVTDSSEDEWNLYKPYIHEDAIYIACLPRFANAMMWKGDSVGFGVASTDETFATSVPVTVQFEDQENAAGKEQDIFLIIPLKGLGNERPSNVYTKLCMVINDEEIDVRVNFTIEW